MHFHINPTSLVPIYLQIKDQLRSAAATGVLPAGAKVPSIRELAVQLRVNPNTVARAYRELEFEGLLTTRRGDGTYIDTASRSLSMSQRLSVLVAEVDALVKRAAQLEIPRADVLSLVEERFDELISEPERADRDPALGSKERR